MNSTNINQNLNEDENEVNDEINIFGKKKIKKIKIHCFKYILILFSILILLIILSKLIIIWIKKYKISSSNKVYNEKSFYIISDKNNTFTIQLQNYKNFMKINASYKNKYIIEEYEKFIFLDEIKCNKYLSICDSIKEVYDQLIYEFQKSKNKSLIEMDNKIHIIIPVEHISAKNINITIPKKFKSEKEINEELIKELDNLSEKYNNLEIRNKSLNKEIETLKNENIILEKKINYIMKFGNSSILDYNNYEIIIDWIKQKVNKKDISFKLIFKMSEQGSYSKDFHKYCDNKGPTLSLIKTKNSKIFGGFTPLNWTSDYINYPRDHSNFTFIFYLNIKKKYDLLDIYDSAIENYDRSGPSFGFGDLRIEFNLKNGNLHSGEYTNFFSNNNLELIDKKGEYYFFEAIEIEVFKVIY